MVANLRLESWQALHQRLRGIAKRRAALDAEEVQCLREAQAIEIWRKLGYVHMAEYLERELGYGPQVGAERLRVARELSELPRIEAGLASGGLSYSAVRELTRVATGDTELAWLEAVRGKSLRQIEAMVAGRKRGDRPCDPSTPELLHRVVRLELSPAAFALLRQTQAALADEHGERLDDSSFVETLCRRALEAGAPADRPAHQIAFTVCESCDGAWQNGAGREIKVGREVIERARCDAEWLGSLQAEQPARVTTTVTPRMRRQVFARDHQRCTVPGCRSARNLDVHHIEYQRDGGAHDLRNLTAICTGHHQQLHEGALEIRGHAPDALEIVWCASPGEPAAAQGPCKALESRRAHPNHRAGAGSHGQDVNARSAAQVQRVGTHGADIEARSADPDQRPGAGTHCADIEAHSAAPDQRPGGDTHCADIDARSADPDQRPGADTHGDASDEPASPAAARHSTTSASMGDAAREDERSGERAPAPIEVAVLAQHARATLAAAGYAPRVARLAVAHALPHVGAAPTLEQLIRAALRAAMTCR